MLERLLPNLFTKFKNWASNNNANKTATLLKGSRFILIDKG